jgi:tyrosine-protein phosphatase SIW14
MDRTRPQHLRRNLLRTSRLRFAAVLYLGPLLAWGETPDVPHIRNFGQVNEQIYRGAEPSPIALKELKANRVTVVIDLREAGRGASDERNDAKGLGLRYINIPLRPWSAPTSEETRRVLWELIGHPQDKIFIHCRRGKDRTGTVIACYRIQHDKWSNARALEEAESFGMSSLERRMRSFILDFSPLSDTTFAQTPSGPLPVPASRP